MNHKMIRHTMLFFETILSHLFPIYDFVSEIFLYIFHMFWYVKQPYDIGIRCIRYDKLCWYYILRPWDNLRRDLIIHDYIVFKHDSITTFCHNHRWYVMVIFYLFVCDIQFLKVLLIWNVIHCFDDSLLVINHCVDVISKCYCWVHVYL